MRELEIVRRLRSEYPGIAITFPREDVTYAGAGSPIQVFDVTLHDIGGRVGEFDVMLDVPGHGFRFMAYAMSLPPPNRLPRSAAVIQTRQIHGIESMPDWSRMPA